MRFQDILIAMLVFGLFGTILFSSVNYFEDGYNFTVQDEEFAELTDSFENLTTSTNDNAKSLTDYNSLNRSISADDITGSLEINGFQTIDSVTSTGSSIFNSFKVMAGLLPP